MDFLTFLSNDFVTSLLTFIVVVLFFQLYTYLYWKKSNIPMLLPVTDNRYLQKENLGFKFKHFYDDVRAQGWKHGGVSILHRPVYIPVDLDIIKNILTKDFDYFSDRIVYSNEKSDPLLTNLFSLNGHKWRMMRTKLSPTFTSGKMRMMFQSLLGCGADLLDRVEHSLRNNEPTDIKELLGCFTTDTIGSCAFGLECDSFTEENALFRKYGKDFFITTPSKFINMTFAFIFPSLAQALGATYTEKELTEFFIKSVRDTVTFRETTNYRRQDFMQILIDLKNDENAEGIALTINDIAAQCFNFFTAGFEAASTTMTFALYEISCVTDYQDRLRKEIFDVLDKNGGEITYESLQKMKYLDQVVSETLRLYPAVSFLTRRCVKDYKFEDDDVTIRENTPIVISVLGIHRDPEHYPEPEKFDPERFSDENKQLRHNYAYIPFGEGPRICIGARFGLLQTKIGLVMLLKKYKFTVNEKTQEPITTKYDSLGLCVEGEVWLNVEKV